VPSVRTSRGFPVLELLLPLCEFSLRFCFFIALLLLFHIGDMIRCIPMHTSVSFLIDTSVCCSFSKH
jgi:hypothetical protein